ncbi:MAG: methyltransferase [Candidatus Calescibacterium sp.]|nr:methyltransferase [Candidatus Calescibacterium sp.]MCX7971791.1 methyltransferase [bacterium]MDW8195397.1 methyltransferase [Candidatus Calescibacterium sp.]
MKLFELIKHLKSEYIDSQKKNQKKILIKNLIKIIEIAIEKKFPLWDNQQILTQNELIKCDKLSKMVFKYHFPIQYLESIVKFGEIQLYINPYTLIPRPETEIITQEIFSSLTQNHNIGEKFNKIFLIDFGIGSGNIILSLVKKLQNYYKSLSIIPIGIDISFNALLVAQKNSHLNNIDINLINFSKIDIIKKSLPSQSIQILISNPPYLTKKELKQELKFEPENALLTPKKTYFYNLLLNFLLQKQTSSFIAFFEIDKKALEKIIRKLKKIKNKINYNTVYIQRKIFLLEISNKHKKSINFYSSYTYP